MFRIYFIIIYPYLLTSTYSPNLRFTYLSSFISGRFRFVSFLSVCRVSFLFHILIVTKLFLDSCTTFRFLFFDLHFPTIHFFAKKYCRVAFYHTQRDVIRGFPMIWIVLDWILFRWKNVQWSTLLRFTNRATTELQME